MVHLMSHQQKLLRVLSPVPASPVISRPDQSQGLCGGCCPVRGTRGDEGTARTARRAPESRWQPGRETYSEGMEPRTKTERSEGNQKGTNKTIARIHLEKGEPRQQ